MTTLAQEIAEFFAREDYVLGLSARMLKILRASFAEVSARLSDGDLDGPRRGQLTGLFREIDRLLGEGYQRMNAALVRELGEYHGVEAQHALNSIARMGKLDNAVFLSRPLMLAIADLPIEGRNLGDWWQKMAAGMSSKVRSSVQLGLTLGEGGSTIARRVMQARNLDPSRPEIWRQARSETNSFVLTVANSVHNEAALGTYKALGQQGVVKGVRFRAVRDSRTTPVCRGFDGRVFRLDDPALALATPPLHIRCRSTFVPVVNPKACLLYTSRCV